MPTAVVARDSDHGFFEMVKKLDRESLRFGLVGGVTGLCVAPSQRASKEEKGPAALVPIFGVCLIIVTEYCRGRIETFIKQTFLGS